MRRFAPFATAALVAWAVLAGAALAADPAPAVTHHSVTVGGRPIAYAARAGMTVLRDAAGDETAHVFSVAYSAEGADVRTRPVTFVFNGGPGSSSMWLHLGSYGPMRLAIPSNAAIPAPGTPLLPNPDSLIDVSDLVFVDAVGTGYSKIVGKGTAKTFYGIDEDAKAFDAFIRAWTTENGRWASPKFLFGESYGTMRAATVVDRLQRDGMSVNGVVLVSSALDYNALDNGQGPGEDYGYITFLPTEAAVAWYHQKAAGNPSDLARFVDEVRAFAIGPYADALMRGDDLDAATRRSIVAKLHAYTGLDEAYIDRANLRIDPSRFEQMLLNGAGITTGRLDGRYRGPTLDRTNDSPTYDPASDDMLTDAFVGAFSRYVRDDLGFNLDRPYMGTNYSEVGANWNFRRTRSVLAPNGSRDLREAMTKNPYLRVFAANGYYDLATPFFGTEYTLGHLGLDPALRPHIHYGFYPSGHMIYLNDEARRALKADLVRFYREATVR
ncbi:MAG: peptidase [Candidatus Eremiobacteraeota bacterium]|nr:peptidase [Candidatus Eremiobacteraeota bacterium]